LASNGAQFRPVWQARIEIATLVLGDRAMSITVVLKDEAAQIVEREVSEGRYPDAESAVTAALMLLEDAAIDWGDVDASAVRQMIAESDAEGGEIPFDEAIHELDKVIAARQR
jgi:Arc/MetJ-type ribon-helix-helix transcriptional regulator